MPDHVQLDLEVVLTVAEEAGREAAWSHGQAGIPGVLPGR